MALVLRGGSAVIWSKSAPTFPFIKGMLVIFLSWVCSPICSGASVINTSPHNHDWHQSGQHKAGRVSVRRVCSQDFTII